MEFNINFPGSSIIDEAIKLKCYFVPFPLSVYLFSLPLLLTRQKSFFIYDSVINLCVLPINTPKRSDRGLRKAPLAVDTWPQIVCKVWGRGMCQ